MLMSILCEPCQEVRSEEWNSIDTRLIVDDWKEDFQKQMSTFDLNNGNLVQLKALNFQFRHSATFFLLLFSFYTIINFSLSLSQLTQTFSSIVSTTNMYFNAIWSIVSIKFHVICMKNDSALNFVLTSHGRHVGTSFQCHFLCRSMSKRDSVKWKKMPTYMIWGRVQCAVIKIKTSLDRLTKV